MDKERISWVAACNGVARRGCCGAPRSAGEGGLGLDGPAGAAVLVGDVGVLSPGFSSGGVLGQGAIFWPLGSRVVGLRLGPGHDGLARLGADDRLHDRTQEVVVDHDAGGRVPASADKPDGG